MWMLIFAAAKKFFAGMKKIQPIVDSFFMETVDEQLSSLFNKIIPFDKISINMYLIVVKLVKIDVLIYIKSKFNYELCNFPLTNFNFSVRFSISCSSFRYPFHF